MSDFSFTIALPTVTLLRMAERYSKMHPPSKVNNRFDIVNLEAAIADRNQLDDVFSEITVTAPLAVNAIFGTSGLMDIGLASINDAPDPRWLLEANYKLAEVMGVLKTRDVLIGIQPSITGTIAAGSTLDTEQPIYGRTLRQLGQLMGKTPSVSGSSWRFAGVSAKNRRKFADLCLERVPLVDPAQQHNISSTGRNALGHDTLK
jgi:hypothetical protein